VPVLPKLRSLLRNFFSSERVETDLDQEIHSHLEMLTEENLRAGMLPEEARRAARIELGGIEQVKEQVRDERIGNWLHSVFSDCRFALRQLHKSPAFTAVAVLTLALGIGANTAMFSVMDAVELRQLPVRQPERLVLLHWTAHRPTAWHSYSNYFGCDPLPNSEATPNCSFPYPVFDMFRARSHSLESISAFAGPAQVQAAIRGEIQRAEAGIVSGEFFSTLGVPPWMGRTLNSDDDQLGVEPVVVLSFRFWQDHFASDPKVVGTTLARNGAPFTIVGVAQREFFGLQPIGVPDFWIPVHSAARLGPGFWSSLDGQSAWLYAIGRLKPNVLPEQARAELDVLFRGILSANSESFRKSEGESGEAHVDLNMEGGPRLAGPEIANKGDAESNSQPGIALTSAARGLAGLRLRYSAQLQVLMAVVVLVLLVACANVANLLLARASARRREISVRLALGATRARLVRQLFTESLLLALLGAAAGFLLSVWTSRALVALLVPGDDPIMLGVHPNLTVFGFTAVVAGVAAILFGLVPAVTSARLDPAIDLKASLGEARGSGTGMSHRSWFRRSLVAGEMAVALVLLVCASLFLRTLETLRTLDPGFRKENLLIVETSPRLVFHDPTAPSDHSPKSSNVAAQSAALQARLAALPGVRSVS
jgi:predicted permease